MLLDKWDFGHDCNRDVRQIGRWPTIWRNPRQNPCRSLLVHQPTRAINGVNDDDVREIVVVYASGKVAYARFSQAFSNQSKRHHGTQCRKLFDEDSLGDPINCKYRISAFFGVDMRQLFERTVLARTDHCIANMCMDLLYVFAELTFDAHWFAPSLR